MITKPIEDLYPSRVGREVSITPRKDPVVWGKEPGPLSQKELESFDRDGYLLFPELFTPREASAFLRKAEKLRDDPSWQDREEVIREPGSGVVRSLFNIHRLDPLFEALSRDPRLMDRMAQILGSRLYLHQSRVNLKPGLTGKEFYWHSDFETWHVEDGMPRMRAVSCSIALTENYEFNGPLMVMPGSHKRYLACAGRTPEDHYKQSLRRQDYGVPEPAFLELLARENGIRVPKGAPGSVVFFECNMMHGSNSNITPFPRSNVFMVYNSVENALVEPFGGVKPRPDFIASRDFTPLEPQKSDYEALLQGGGQ